MSTPTAELEAQFNDDFKRLIALNSEPVQIEMSKMLAWAVAWAIQHACKDPRFTGRVPELAAEFARSLYRESATTPALQQVAEDGWKVAPEIEQTPTKAQLAQVFGELVCVIDGWNDAAQDDDRGRDNAALAIVLYDDGSGKVGTAHFLPPIPCEPTCSVTHEQWFNEQHSFDNIGQLVEYLAAWTEIKE